MESEKQALLRDKDTVLQEKSGLQHDLLRVEREKQDLVTQKSGN